MFAHNKIHDVCPNCFATFPSERVQVSGPRHSSTPRYGVEECRRTGAVRTPCPMQRCKQRGRNKFIVRTCVDAVSGRRSNRQAATPAVSSCCAMCWRAVAHEKGLAFSTRRLVGMLQHPKQQWRTTQHSLGPPVPWELSCSHAQQTEPGMGCAVTNHLAHFNCNPKSWVWLLGLHWNMIMD
jgi:hypothetical protein